ncbi:sulfurtransferase TusA family protein [Ascidiaceihabitans sp.]|nr:sulfurtransferase TusA family protein [Ascidiaceihabitans sp.]
MSNKKTHLDARGLLCPLPVLKARKRLQAIAVGETLTMIADDPAAVIDVPHFCMAAGHELVSSEANGNDQTYVIRKSS